LIEEASGFGQASEKPSGLDGRLGEKIENPSGHSPGDAGPPGFLAEGRQGEPFDGPG
jgi:hypothetical protein